MAKRLVFLDLEGTLIDVPHVVDSPVPKSMWQSLARILGPACLREEEESHRRWIEGTIPNYVIWMDETVRSFIRHGLHRKHIEALNALVETNPGVVDFADRIRAMGGALAIVTGALKSVAEPIFLATKSEHLFAGCELFFDLNGSIVHWNLLPSDWYGKVDFMELLIREYGVNRRQCVFIGDGANDIELAKRVGLSIGYNADIELEKVTTLNVKQCKKDRDFSVLASYVEDFWKKR